MSMDKSAAHSYVYAKACGMLAKSFVAERARNLFMVSSLQELWSLIFKTAVPVVPEALLAKRIEREAEKKFISEYLSLLSNYNKPAKLLLALLHFYDYDNMKEIGAALCTGEKKAPHIVDISPYNLIAYDRWPNIEEMTSDSSLSWYNTVPQLFEQQKNDYKLDCQYISELWSSVSSMEKSCQSAIKDLLEERFCMENILWALRLRIYYGMSKDEIISHLVFTTEKKDKREALVIDAIRILDWETDSWDQWKDWKYASLLNPHEEGNVWHVDPRWISNAYQKRYVQQAKRLFHQFPGTSCPLACWFIVKQRELDNIRTASEHLRLKTDSLQAMNIAGITEVTNG